MEKMREAKRRHPPREESFSFFYKFDDVKCYASNPGIIREVARIPAAHMRNLWPDDLWPYED